MFHTVAEKFRALVRRVLMLFARLFGKEPTDEAYNGALQFIRFLLVGLTGTVVQVGVYYLLVFNFGDAHYLWWNTIAYCASIVDLYFWNREVVFRGNKTNFGTFLRFCSCYGVTYVLQQTLLLLFVDALHISHFIAPLMAMFLSTPVSFTLNKVFTFRDQKKEGSA